MSTLGECPVLEVCCSRLPIPIKTNIYNLSSHSRGTHFLGYLRQPCHSFELVVVGRGEEKKGEGDGRIVGMKRERKGKGKIKGGRAEF